MTAPEDLVALGDAAGWRDDAAAEVVAVAAAACDASRSAAGSAGAADVGVVTAVGAGLTGVVLPAALLPFGPDFGSLKKAPHAARCCSAALADATGGLVPAVEAEAAAAPRLLMLVVGFPYPVVGFSVDTSVTAAGWLACCTLAC